MVIMTEVMTAKVAKIIFRAHGNKRNNTCLQHRTILQENISFLLLEKDHSKVNKLQPNPLGLSPVPSLIEAYHFEQHANSAQLQRDRCRRYGCPTR